MNLFYKKCSELFDLTGQEIVGLMEAFYQDNSESEKKSWRTSLPQLLNVVKQAGLGNVYLATEYELPAGGRIDAVLLGDDANGNHNALVIELKQWSRNGVDQLGSGVWVKSSSRPYPAKHPVTQAKIYADTLKSNHSNVIEGDLHIYGCQYLHNFGRDEKSFFKQGLFADIDISKLFCNGEEASFADFLKTIFVPYADAESAKNLFVNGEYIPTKMDMEIIKEITESPENIPLWSDQDEIHNQEGLNALPGTIYSYTAVISGTIPSDKYPVKEKIDLKIGAKVMFLRNDNHNHEYQNGTIGIVKECYDDGVIITVGKKDVYLTPYEYTVSAEPTYNPTTGQIEQELYDGTYTQLPLCLAYAITVHKSQGQTFDSINFDPCGNGTEYLQNGQLYVALSRLTSIDGLYCYQKIKESEWQTSQKVIEFPKQDRIDLP